MAGIFDGRIEITKESARFGYTRNGGAKWHGGVDVICPDQPADTTSVYAVEGGRVTQSRIVNNGAGAGTAEWGNYVTVQGSATGKYHIYAHLASRAVQAGQTVKTGEKIGVMGDTGNAAGGYKHVHYEVRSTAGGTGIDPAPYLGVKNKVGIYGTPAGTANKTEGDEDMKLRVFEMDTKGETRTSLLIEDPARAGIGWNTDGSRVMLKSVWASGEITAGNISAAMDAAEKAGYGKPGNVAFLTDD